MRNLHHFFLVISLLSITCFVAAGQSQRPLLWESPYWLSLKELSVRPLCYLCLRGKFSLVSVYHRGKENTEDAQGKTKSIMGVAKLTDQNTVVPAESKYAKVERERRYLLQDLPEGLSRADPHVQITDNYLTGTRLRIRKVREPRTNKWTVKFTQKFAPYPQDFSRTIITNTYLNALEAETLSVFDANEIRKNRYPFEYQGRKFSVDMFLGDLFGLVLSEVSFETDEELDSFAKPPFAIADVTNNEIFTGGRLCGLTFEDIRDEILKRSSSVTSK